MLLPLLAITTLSAATLSDAERRALLAKVALGDFERLLEELGEDRYLKLVAALPDGELKWRACFEVREYFDSKIFSGPGHRQRARSFRDLLKKHHDPTDLERRRQHPLWRAWSLYDMTDETHVDLSGYPDATPFADEIQQFFDRHER